MKIDDLYIQDMQIKLHVVLLLDFCDLPILNLEQDEQENKYLSYLGRIEDNIEYRYIISVDFTKLQKVMSGKKSVLEAFKDSRFFYFATYDTNTGKQLKMCLMRKNDAFLEEVIPKDYRLEL